MKTKVFFFFAFAHMLILFTTAVYSFFFYCYIQYTILTLLTLLALLTILLPTILESLSSHDDDGTKNVTNLHI